MKALELNVYPIWESGFGDHYADKEDPMHPVRVDFEVYRKRLTDVELAAELHAQEVRILTIEKSSPHNAAGPSAYRKLEALHRLATLPHYDEVPTEEREQA